MSSLVLYTKCCCSVKALLAGSSPAWWGSTRSNFLIPFSKSREKELQAYLRITSILLGYNTRILLQGMDKFLFHTLLILLGQSIQRYACVLALRSNVDLMPWSEVEHTQLWKEPIHLSAPWLIVFPYFLSWNIVQQFLQYCCKIQPAQIGPSSWLTQGPQAC